MIRYTAFIFCLTFLFSQTTGKISGLVTDTETGEPLIGASVRILEYNLGSATDKDGYYYIINIEPGTYDLEAQYIGYESKVIKNISVSVNRTTHYNISIMQSSVKGAVVEVSVSAMNLKKDQTSTVKNISSD